MRLAASVLALLLAASPALALDTPNGTGADARVKYVDYNENDVVAVYAKHAADTLKQIG